VFDARADWIGLVAQAGGTVSLRSIKCRDGECGPIGSWSIEAVETTAGTVPTLVWMPTTITASDDSMDQGERDRVVLRAIVGGVTSKRDIAVFTGLSPSTCGRTITRLRAAGWLAKSVNQATKSGAEYAKSIE
jgi:hypothetical protein